MTYRHFNNETTRSSVIRAVADTENEAAWQKLFDLYAGFVFSIARSKGLKEEDADDVVQVVFSDLARNLPTFQYDRAKGKFRSYLTGLVHWRVMDKLKAGKRDAELKAAFCEEAKFWEEVKTILMPYFQRKFPSVGEADRMRDFFLETDIYRELALLEEWIRSGMKLTPVQFADALRTSYVVYATWITEVASGKPATQFPEEMFDEVRFIK